MKPFRAVITLLALAVMLRLPVLAENSLPRVLFDEAHDEVNTLSESRARQIDSAHPEFCYFGALADAVSRDYALARGLSRLDSSFLAGFDVVVISTPRAAYQQQELDALKAFVESGGGLLLLQNSGPSPTTGSNQIAELFGVSFRSGPLLSRNGDWDAGSFQADVVDSWHAVTLGCTSFQMNWGCSIVETADCDVLLASKVDTWQDSNGDQRADVAEPSGPLPVAVAMTAAQGRVVLIADNSFHNDLWNQNGTLFLNALRWLVPLATGSEPGTTYAFTVDQDVTRDSVVQVGDAPQARSTEIQFYPNTRRILPGETIYWTLDLGSLEGPFTIIPELDNDGQREATIRTDEPLLVIPHTYDTAGIYVPCLSVYDAAGDGVEIHSCSVLGVIPVLAARQGVGVDLPRADGSVGDYLKAMHVYGFDYMLFGDSVGERFIQEELDRIAGLGVNMMIYNIGWVFDQPTDAMHEPVYGAAGWRDACCSWVSTLSVDALTKLSDWSHERGMRVAIRYFLWRKCSSAIGRETYAPSSIDLYMEQQTQIKLLYAELCQSLGIEVFFLDAENNAFTLEPRVKELIPRIRSIYHGLLSDGAYNVATIYGCPFAADLDFLAWSDYYYDTHETSDSAAVDQLTDAYIWHYMNEVRPVLEYFGKPGMVLETGVNIREETTIVAERRYTAYLEAFVQLQRSAAPVVGSGWWVWNLSDPQVEPNCMRGRSTEGILADYFGTALSDEFSLRFLDRAMEPPAVSLSLEDFEHGPGKWEISQLGSSVEPAAVEDPVRGGSCLRVDYRPTSTADYRHGFLRRVLASRQDWSRFASFNFWLKSSAENWGLEVGFYDADGDRFLTRVDTLPHLAELLLETDGWHFVSIPFALFAEPSWHTGGNGVMDWRHVDSWCVGLFYAEQGAQTLWFDDFYLSVQGALP